MILQLQARNVWQHLQNDFSLCLQMLPDAYMGPVHVGAMTAEMTA